MLRLALAARLAIGCVLALLLLAPAPARAAYEPRGEYLGLADDPPVTESPNVRFDGAGIPMVRYGQSFHYNPVTTSQFGLQAYSRFLRSGDAGDLATATLAADWLVDEQDTASGAWLYDFDHEVGGMNEELEAPWASAMAQGQAISLLTRMHAHTGDARYLAAATAALAPLHLPVSDGGLRTEWEDYVFFEEYPTATPSLVLNGFMFTLLGLYDLKAAGNADALELYDEGFESLEALLPRYDTGGVSAYHLGHLTKPPRGILAFTNYHWVHVEELEALNSVTPSPVLSLYHDRWAAYKPPAVAKPRPPTPVIPPSFPQDLQPPSISKPGLAGPLRAGVRRLRLQFRVSEAASVRFTLLAGKRPIATRALYARPGKTMPWLTLPRSRRLAARRYTLHFMARDAAGNRSERHVTVRAVARRVR